MGGHAPSHIPRLVPWCVVWDPQGQNICKVCWTQSGNTMNRLCYSAFIMFSVLCFSAVSSNFFSMCSLILCRSCKPFFSASTAVMPWVSIRRCTFLSEGCGMAYPQNLTSGFFITI
uniref:Uncharacterized protein n=1 Tax=Rhipicephalus microplus TaxID=6941 RepID=A0A6G5AFX7_RHIMP